ncbi:hypothetical protein HY406_00615 [Candidatus Giovannonibacteria bacterium]|nr:hypothetical protein [Candidatus Giovannonibacteria bacterium]
MRFFALTVILALGAVLAVWLIQKFFSLPPGTLFIVMAAILIAGLTASSLKKRA